MLALQPTRILLGNFAGVLAEMLKVSLLTETDIRFVGSVSGAIEVLNAARTGVDIVILGVERVNPPPGLCSQLLNEFPGIKVLVYSPNENVGVGYWLGVRRCNIKQTSRDRLLMSIRYLSQITTGL